MSYDVLSPVRIEVSENQELSKTGGASPSSENWPAVVANAAVPLGVLAVALYWTSFLNESAFYSYFGIDSSVDIKFQNQESAARNVSTLFTPTAILLTLIIVGARLRNWIGRINLSADHARALEAVLNFVSTTILIAIVVSEFTNIANLWSGSPGGFTLGFQECILGLLALGSLTLARKMGEDRPGGRIARQSRQERIAILLLCVTLSVTLIGYHATSSGYSRARFVASAPSSLYEVALYTKEPLAISGSDIHKVELHGLAYSHRYSGLRLLASDDSRYFFIDRGFDFRDQVFVINKNEDVRIDFIS